MLLKIISILYCIIFLNIISPINLLFKMQLLFRTSNSVTNNPESLQALLFINDNFYLYLVQLDVILYRFILG